MKITELHLHDQKAFHYQEREPFVKQETTDGFYSPDYKTPGDSSVALFTRVKMKHGAIITAQFHQLHRQVPQLLKGVTAYYQLPDFDQEFFQTVHYDSGISTIKKHITRLWRDYHPET